MQGHRRTPENRRIRWINKNGKRDIIKTAGIIRIVFFQEEAVRWQSHWCRQTAVIYHREKISGKDAIYETTIGDLFFLIISFQRDNLMQQMCCIGGRIAFVK